MSKPQLVWLIIRLAGVYFAYLALVSFFGLVGTLPGLYTLPKIDTDQKNANVASRPSPVIQVQPITPDGVYNPMATPGSTPAKEDESITEKFTAENVKDFAWFLVVTVLYGVAAWYLIRDGRVLYDVLNREEPNGLRRETPEVTTLNLSDEQN